MRRRRGGCLYPYTLLYNAILTLCTQQNAPHCVRRYVGRLRSFILTPLTVLCESCHAKPPSLCTRIYVRGNAGVAEENKPILYNTVHVEFRRFI
jgi:hypothetical protein